MIICKKCGHRNADTDQWCTNPGCGAYLAFEGVAQPSPAPAQPPADPNADTLDNLGKTVPPPQPAAAPAPPPGQYQPQPPTADRPPVMPASSPETAIPPIRPGEIVCTSCHWGNDPTRNFCRHCGSPLVASSATEPQAPPASPQYAQETPAARRWPWILVAGVAAASLLVIGFLVNSALTGTKDKGGNAAASEQPSPTPTTKGTAVPVATIAARASTSEPDAGARYVIDGDPGSYWAASPTDSNPDPVPQLTFTFKDPDGAKVVRLMVASGGLPGDYLTRPRPKDVCVRVDGGECSNHELADIADPQEIRVDAAQPVHQVELEIKSVYPASQPGYGNGDVTIREVTLYAQA